MTGKAYERKGLGSTISKVIPDVTESYQYNKQHMFVDAGLYMGRSFRVGWGPGWTIAHAGDIVDAKEEGKYSHCAICVSVLAFYVSNPYAM